MGVTAEGVAAEAAVGVAVEVVEVAEVAVVAEVAGGGGGGLAASRRPWLGHAS